MSLSSVFKHVAMMAPLMGIPMAAEAAQAGAGTVGDIGLQTLYSVGMMTVGAITGLPVVFDAVANGLNGVFAPSVLSAALPHHHM